MNMISEISPGNGIVDTATDMCGAVAIDCSKLAGVIQQVASSGDELRVQRDHLGTTVDALVAEHDRVMQAGDESRNISEQAISRLESGKVQLDTALRKTLDLVDLLDMLGQRVTGFAAAMEQVKASSEEIASLAESTHILALNAGIHAERAGEKGRSFAVVAKEVKDLSAESGRVAAEIGATVGKLDSAAHEVVRRMKIGQKAATKTRKISGQVDEMFASVGELVEEVDRHNAQIGAAASHAGEGILTVGESLVSINTISADCQVRLHDAQVKMQQVEWTASDMFDAFVKAGMSPADAKMAELATEYAEKFVKIAETALADGTLSRDCLFDRDYREITDSNPPRYTTGLTEWADANWRSIIDEGLARGRPIKMLAVADENGFLPTHATERSRKPTGDVTHDTLWCRNGRKFLGSMDRKARQMTGSHMMAVHRQEGDGVHSYVVRNVYVPLIIAGKRWGIMELAYILDDAAWPKQ